MEHVALSCLLVNACDVVPTYKADLCELDWALRLCQAELCPCACILLPQRSVPSTGVQLAVLSLGQSIPTARQINPPFPQARALRRAEAPCKLLSRHPRTWS